MCFLILPALRTLEWKKNFIQQGSIVVVSSALVSGKSIVMLPAMITHKYDAREPTVGVPTVPEAVWGMYWHHRHTPSCESRRWHETLRF